MRLLHIILTSILLTGTAHGQLLNFLNEIKKNIEKDLGNATVPSSSNQSSENLPVKSQPATSRDKALSGYCDRISNADFTNKIGEIYLKSVQTGNVVAPRYAIDGYGNDLQKWVVSKFSSDLNIVVGTGYQPENHVSVIYDTINECLEKNQDKKFINAFVTWNIKKGTKEFLISSPRTNLGLIENNMGGRNLLLFAYLFEGADEKIQTVFPQLVKTYESEVQASISQQEKYRKDAQEKQAKEEANAAIETKLKQELKQERERQAAYLETSDGQLISAYQKFQVIQTCYEIRKESLVKFISESEYSDSRSKMKNIEGKLKISLTEKDTDKLWTTAEANNRKYDLLKGRGEKPVYYDVIETIVVRNKDDWTRAKNECDDIFQDFRRQSLELLGKESLKKNF
jgi:hypothetical protein